MGQSVLRRSSERTGGLGQHYRRSSTSQRPPTPAQGKPQCTLDQWEIDGAMAIRSDRWRPTLVLHRRRPQNRVAHRRDTRPSQDDRIAPGPPSSPVRDVSDGPHATKAQTRRNGAQVQTCIPEPSIWRFGRPAGHRSRPSRWVVRASACRLRPVKGRTRFGGDGSGIAHQMWSTPSSPTKRERQQSGDEGKGRSGWARRSAQGWPSQPDRVRQDIDDLGAMLKTAIASEPVQNVTELVARQEFVVDRTGAPQSRCPPTLPLALKLLGERHGRRPDFRF
ncbi:MAG: hypothetical protein QOG97_1127 [Acidimicrobiaceae bacterium]|nr:hypothetical protein [Acidimicrobiaceae bacterium]